MREKSEKDVVKWHEMAYCVHFTLNFVRFWPKMMRIARTYATEKAPAPASATAAAVVVAPFFALDSFPFCLNKIFHHHLIKMRCHRMKMMSIYDLLTPYIC